MQPFKQFCKKCGENKGLHNCHNKTQEPKKKTYISPDPIKAYKQGWKDGRDDLIMERFT